MRIAAQPPGIVCLEAVFPPNTARNGFQPVSQLATMRVPRCLFVLSVLVMSSGCVATLVGADTPPDETFDLPTEPVISATSETRGVQILVPEPVTLEILSSPNVVVRVSDNVVEYLANARLTDSLPRLTQFKLKRTLESAQGVGAVGLPGQGLAIDYQLLTDIRAFEVRVTGGSETAFVSITGKLLDDRTGNVIASRLFQTSAPVPTGESNDRYITAVNAALTAALADMRDWVQGRLLAS